MFTRYCLDLIFLLAWIQVNSCLTIIRISGTFTTNDIDATCISLNRLRHGGIMHGCVKSMSSPELLTIWELPDDNVDPVELIDTHFNQSAQYIENAQAKIVPITLEEQELRLITIKYSGEIKGEYANVSTRDLEHTLGRMMRQWIWQQADLNELYDTSVTRAHNEINVYMGVPALPMPQNLAVISAIGLHDTVRQYMGKIIDLKMTFPARSSKIFDWLKPLNPSASTIFDWLKPFNPSGLWFRMASCEQLKEFIVRKLSDSYDMTYCSKSSFGNHTFGWFSRIPDATNERLIAEMRTKFGTVERVSARSYSRLPGYDILIEGSTTQPIDITENEIRKALNKTFAVEEKIKIRRYSAISPNTQQQFEIELPNDVTTGEEVRFMDFYKIMKKYFGDSKIRFMYTFKHKQQNLDAAVIIKFAKTENASNCIQNIKEWMSISHDTYGLNMILNGVGQFNIKITSEERFPSEYFIKKYLEDKVLETIQLFNCKYERIEVFVGW